jgi:hypothetical protein
VTVPVKGPVDTFVACPSGTVPSGGGGGSTGEGSFISSSAASGNGWAVKVSNITDAPEQAAAHAVCTAATHTRVTGARVSVPGRRPLSPTVPPGGGLPAGLRHRRAFLSASRMDVDTSGRWRVDLANNDGPAHSASAFVVCTTVPLTVRQTSIVLESGEQDHVTAVCLPGRRVMGGGAHAPGSGAGVPPQPGVAITTNRGLPDPTGWGAHAKNHTDRPQELFIQAYCTTS